MATLWRLCQSRFLSTPFDGEGTRLYGGRWTSRGQPVVHLSTEASCVALETLVHITAIDIAPAFHLLEVRVSERLMRAARVVQIAELPAGWDGADLAPCRKVGDAWRAEPTHPALLVVPSAVVHQSRNVLLDAAHRDAADLEVVASTPLAFDGRLRAK